MGLDFESNFGVRERAECLQKYSHVGGSAEFLEHSLEIYICLRLYEPCVYSQGLPSLTCQSKRDWPFSRGRLSWSVCKCSFVLFLKKSLQFITLYIYFLERQSRILRTRILDSYFVFSPKSTTYLP